MKDKDILNQVLPGSYITLNDKAVGKTYNLTIDEFEACLDDEGNLDMAKVEKLKG